MLDKELSSRISIAELFRLTSYYFEKDYGNDLVAYSFESKDCDEWYKQFRNNLIDSIGKIYLPVYRMADGEYQFLWGIRFDFHSLWKNRYILSYCYRKSLELLKGPVIKTSWGEFYKGDEITELRRKYFNDLEELLRYGILCAFLYETSKNTFVHYNKQFLKYFNNKELCLDINNFFPFHFPFFALSNPGWQDFIVNRKILIVTGNLINRRKSLEVNFAELGARKVGFYEISATSSLKDKVDKNMIDDYQEYEIALVAAGIGALNIITQMKWFKGPVIDVGGLLLSYQTKSFICHGGAAKYPVIR